MTYFCPNCSEKLIVHEANERLSWRVCVCCDVCFPEIDGIIFFTEPQKNTEITSFVEQLVISISSKKNQYYEYVEKKKEKGVFEVYAALQPFNESTRALYPFINGLREILEPGDVIFDSWSRTGWHAYLLAALFPDQKIISSWEGNSSVLGYAGYGFWFSPEKRPSNLDIVFIKEGDLLPFEQGSIKFIFAHDVLHRYKFPEYSRELDRVLDRKGVLFYAHVHLNNSEPNPYFKRGGVLRHGETYKKHFSETNAFGRTSIILAEDELFSLDQGKVSDASEGLHYNGVILSAEDAWLEKSFENRLEKAASISDRILLNPLLSVDFISGVIGLNQTGLGGQAGYFIERHPCYKARLQEIIGEKVCLHGREVLALAGEGKTLEQIGTASNIELQELVGLVDELRRKELCAVLPVSQSALDLQAFHCNEQYVYDVSFTRSWQNTLRTNTDLVFPLKLEGQDLMLSEVNDLILCFACHFYKEGLRAGNHLEMSCSVENEKSIFVAMGAWLIGVLPVFTNEDENRSTKFSGKYSIESFWDIVEYYIGNTVPLNDGGFDAYYSDDVSLPWYQLFFQHQMKRR